MKKLATFLSLLLTLCLCTSALAEVTFEGVVVSGETVSVTAPFGGTVENLRIRPGSVLSQGDEITTLQTTKVYAPSDGQVISVFAAPGDSLEDITARYGAALYLTPENLYTIEADIQYAYSSTETKYVMSGETVYISCEDDKGKHTAEGTITAVTGTTFTVLSTSGELKLNEDVRIYRDSAHSAKQKIGGGTVARVADVSVTGTGSLLYMHVQPGDTVTRGQLLFETVGGTLDGLYATDNRVLAPVGGIVANVNAQTGAPVNKGDCLLTLYPRDSLQIQISISEYDLASIQEGDAVTFTLSYQADLPDMPVYTGVVDSISYLSSAESGEVSYAAYISFNPDDAIRLGMNASVTVE